MSHIGTKGEMAEEVENEEKANETDKNGRVWGVMRRSNIVWDNMTVKAVWEMTEKDDLAIDLCRIEKLDGKQITKGELTDKEATGKGFVWFKSEDEKSGKDRGFYEAVDEYRNRIARGEIKRCENTIGRCCFDSQADQVGGSSASVDRPAADNEVAECVETACVSVT
jgi:hypothetical protein